jgi:pSer/pThr/pTyr-binding forkhead associated (FHA) protein
VITVIQCPFCQTQNASNTIICDECGAYLQEKEEIGTDPFEEEERVWLGETNASQAEDLHDTEPPYIRLRIGRGDRARELEVLLVKPIRLGRIDPSEDFYPEVDLSEDWAKEQGVSRNHACILQNGNAIEVKDLGSRNGTWLHGKRLVPYVSEPLKEGDQLHLGKLPIEVSFVSRHS